MAQYDNSGALWKNNNPKSDKSPSHLGKLTVAGVEYDLAAWVKENDKGKYFSLKVTPKGERRSGQSSNVPDRDVPPF